ncbi:uncharacterized protein ARMOST_11068 [Armillaria ostoyae]|uniref:Uncharacterized protein n=1 Tax=Armillaria ostoyae TaxID=47428 RepID=A0A284RG52_ARMOS|nr:uncharacterized protein ARMOST_11068 [Armillaria ostoyae]
MASFGHRGHLSHSFRRLRSFHLTPQEQHDAPPPAAVIARPSTPPPPPSHPVSEKSRPTIPLLPGQASTSIPQSFKLALCIILSLVFIGAISCVFSGADAGDPPFKKSLDSLGPGIVLIGDNVDVDVDEPSITIRWSIMACGQGNVLPGSEGSHGSKNCGLPNELVYIYVDGDPQPTATYNPADIPFNKDTGLRRNIQNLVQFDSDHVLDVSKARLYPFDKYYLSSTLHAVSGTTNQTLTITKLATMALTANFDIHSTDVESYSDLANGTRLPTRDLDMHINRPTDARGIALLLFIVSWILTHVCIGHVILARRLRTAKPVLKHLVSVGAMLVALPQLRNSMPDAPGLDGFLIDTIGFFPQMVIVGMCIIILLLTVVSREMHARTRELTAPPPRPMTVFKGDVPPPPKVPTTSMEMAPYEMYRLMKHLKGQYVFPPVAPPAQEKQKKGMNKHRRYMTSMGPISEC